MSYILDALRRADAERERGPVPGLHAQPAWAPPTATGPAGAPPAGRRGMTVGVGAILVLALIAWLAWRAFGAGGGGGGGDSAAGSGALAQAPVAAAPSPAAPRPSVIEAPAATTGGGASAARSAAAGEAPAAERLAAERAAAERSTAERPGTNVGVEKPANRATRKPALPVTAAASAASRSTGVLASSSAAPKLYAIDELPEDVRRDLPRLSIGGSIHSESAASRFVIVNGQLLHEGDTVAPGLVLQQIRLKSAVLAFRGYRYTISY